jgi:uncharacterized protein YjbI with pentapeptide repeats
VLPISFIFAVAGLGLLALAAWAWLHFPALPHPKSISLHDWISILQLVFASVAGAGALVALIVTYRRQRVAEADSIRDRTRVFNERFIAIAAQLGDPQAAIRLAGVHAMAGLADEWEENRQTCVDVLCAYLRMPYEPTPGVGASTAEQLAFGGNHEVRHTVIRVIATHLRPGATTSWQGIDLDFTGVQFDGGNFTGVQFSAGTIRFTGARFLAGTVDFGGAIFSGGTVDFSTAKFSGGRVRFSDAQFSGGTIDFSYAQFSGRVLFTGAKFSGSTVRFTRAAFIGDMVRFGYAKFSGGTVDFTRAILSRGEIRFGNAQFSAGAEITFAYAIFSGGSVRFGEARFSGAMINFVGVQFSGSTFYFGDAQFSGGSVRFSKAKFSGGMVRFINAQFSGGDVDFHDIADWSHPPMFSFTGSPPPGVKLP